MNGFMFYLIIGLALAGVVLMLLEHQIFVTGSEDKIVTDLYQMVQQQPVIFIFVMSFLWPLFVLSLVFGR